MTTDQVAEVKAKTEIADIIGERLTLSRAGRNFKAVCPFHEERTASFMVSPELQMYKCFGCDHKGDVYNFLQEYEGMEFIESLKYLADRVGVKLAPIATKSKSERERIFEVNSLASKFYSYLLTKHKIGKDAYQYLKNERGITDETINTFQLGYSPNISFAGRKYLIDKNKITPVELERAGLVYRRGSDVYDRFRGRVIFPLHDHRGNIVGFAGRILPRDSNRDLAKYINNPETAAYHKGNLLYGLNLTRSEIKRSGVAIVVEGELDLISCFQAGIKNVVALKGTAMTEEQVRLISRYANKITIALDADLAGDAAARRGITIASNLGLSVSVLELKDFKDPDDAARNAPQEFKRKLADPVSVWDFIIDSTISKYGAINGENKAKISRDLIPGLSQIADKIVQAHYAKVLSEKLEVPLSAVTEQISGQKTIVNTSKADVKLVENRKDRRALLEERLLALIFVEKLTNAKLDEVQELFTNPKLSRIVNEAKKYLSKHTKFDTIAFVQVLPPELVEGYTSLMMMEIGDEDTVDAVQELEKVVGDLKKEGIKKQQVELVEVMKTLEKSGKQAELAEIQKKYIKLAGELSLLEENSV